MSFRCSQELQQQLTPTVTGTETGTETKSYIQSPISSAQNENVSLAAHRSSDATLVGSQRRVFFKMTQTDEKRPLSGQALIFSSNPQLGYVCVQQETRCNNSRLRGEARRCSESNGLRSGLLLDTIRGTVNQVDALSSSLSRRSLACFLSPVDIVHESAVFSGRLHLIMATCETLRDAGRKLFQSSPSKYLQRCAFPCITPSNFLARSFLRDDCTAQFRQRNSRGISNKHVMCHHHTPNIPVCIYYFSIPGRSASAKTLRT